MSQGQTGDMAGVIVDVHRAGLEPERWPSVVARISAAVGASHGSLHLVDRESGRLEVLGAKGFDAEACREYAEHFQRVDLLTEAIVRSPPGRCFVCSQLVDRWELEQSELYRGFLRPRALSHCMGGLVAEHAGVAAVVAFARPEDRGPFVPEEVSTLRALLQHLAQAVSAHRRLTRMQARVRALEEVVDHWPTGVILAEADGTVAWCNRAASGILRGGDGLRAHRRRLMADHREANRELRALVRRAAADGDGEARGGGTCVPRRSLADQYPVLVAPLSCRRRAVRGLSSRPLAVVFLCDPERVVRTPAGALRRLYRLTPAEARLAEALVAGNRLRDAAGQLAISENTARSYLKRILRKTGTRRQAELVRLVLSGVAPLAAGDEEPPELGGRP